MEVRTKLLTRLSYIDESKFIAIIAGIIGIEYTVNRRFMIRVISQRFLNMNNIERLNKISQYMDAWGVYKLNDLELQLAREKDIEGTISDILQCLPSIVNVNNNNAKLCIVAGLLGLKINDENENLVANKISWDIIDCNDPKLLNLIRQLMFSWGLFEE